MGIIQNPPNKYVRQNAQEAITERWHTIVPDAYFRGKLEGLGYANLTELAAATSISVFNQNLTDARGIEYADSLVTLNLYSNSLTDIGDLSALTSLVTLNLYSNSLTDIGDLSALTSLVTLNLYSNSLTDIGDLSALTSLTGCRLYNNSLTDIGDLSALTSLTVLRLDSNQFAQAGLEAIVDDLWGNRVALGANSCDIRLQTNPGSAATAISRATEISDLIAAGCSVTI